VCLTASVAGWGIHTQAIVDILDTAKLWLYPQIFWAAIALLHSDFEQEYHQAIKLLTKIITRFKGFSDIAAQNVFLTYSPKGWEPPFEGVHKLVLRGILSVETLASSVEVCSSRTLPTAPATRALRFLLVLGVHHWLSSHAHCAWVPHLSAAAEQVHTHAKREAVRAGASQTSVQHRTLAPTQSVTLCMNVCCRCCNVSDGRS
jgi:hypothetical protein